MDSYVGQSLNEDQKQFLRDQGYDIDNQIRNKLSKELQLQKQKIQIERLESILQQKQQIIQEERRQLDEKLKQKQNRLKLKLEQEQMNKQQKQEIFEQKQQRAQQNRENANKRYEELRIQRIQQADEDDRKNVILIDQRWKDKINALQVLKEKDKQIQMKVKLSRQIQAFKDQKALDNWIAYQQLMRSLDKQQHENNAEIQIWRNRLEKEFDFYKQISDEYDQCSNECQRLEAELILNDDDKLEKQYFNVYHKKAVALKRLSDLSTILENYLNEYDRLCKQSESHAQTLQKIKELPTWKQQKHVDLTPSDAIKYYDGPIKFSDMTFEDFMRDYLIRFKEHRDAYDEIMKKGTQPPPQKKEPYDPRVPLKKEMPLPQKPDNATIKKLKQTLRENNTHGTITTWNPYKDERAKQQAELTTKIIHARELALKKARDNARAIGRDLAKREYEFRKALEAAKQAEKAERAAPAENAWKFLKTASTSGDAAAAAATQYVPLESQPYLSKQMPHVPTKSFGLALKKPDETKNLAVINDILKHRGANMESLLKNREVLYQNSLQEGIDELDILGGGKLDLGLPGLGSPKKTSKSPSRPVSRQKGKVPDKGKDKKKDAIPATDDDQWLVSESDDPENEPQMNIKWRKAPPPPARPVPIITNNNVTGQIDFPQKYKEVGQQLRFTESGAYRVPRAADAIPKQMDRIDKNGRIYTETIMVQPEDSRFSSLKMSENGSEFNGEMNYSGNQSITLDQIKPVPKSLASSMKSFKGSQKNLQTLKKLNWSGTIRDDVVDALKASRVKNALTPTVYRGSRESRFVADPEVLNYYDVVEGKPYTLQLTITNASASTQAFKLLDIEEKNRDSFSIKYVKPGEMAPGNSCRLEVTFRYQNPKEPLVDHVHTKISFQTQDGILDVPIHCYILMPNVFVRPRDRRDVDKLAEKLFADTRLNNETHDDQIQQQMRFFTLVEGVNRQFLYILNAGSSAQQMVFRLNKINQYDILTSKVISETDKKIEEYEQQHEQLILDIKNDYQLYDDFVKAGKKGKKPALKNDYETLEIDSNEKLEEFIQQEIQKQLGSKPEKLDQQQIAYSQLVQINTSHDDVQTFINYNFVNMHLLTYYKKIFDQQTYKQDIYEELSAEAKEKAKETILQQLTEKKAEEEALLKKSKKQPEGDSLLIEEYFNSQLEQQSQQLYEQECDKIKQNLQGPKVINERLLQLKFNKEENNTQITFTIPRESIISLPIVHNPATTDFDKLIIKAELEMKSPVDGTVKTYRFDHNFICSDSPIQIMESDLDLLTCFYTQQYNQMFTVKLLDKNDTVTRKVNINIPAGLKQCARVDQSLIIMNQKLNEAHVKLSVTIPSKEFLYNLMQQDNEPWSDISVEFNKFSDTAEGLELGTDMTDMVKSLEETNKQLKEQQEAHVKFTTQKDNLKQQIEDLKPQLEPDPKTGKPNPKAQKAEQQMEEIQNQLETVLGQIDNTQNEISRLQDEVLEITGKLNMTDFVGSYNTLRFSVEVVIQDQPMRLYLPVKLDLTTFEIESDIEASTIKLRDLRPGHLAAFPIRVLNKSAVAQHVTAQIVTAKKLDNDVEIALVPFGGVRLLLPGERGLINMLLQPRFEASQGTFQLKIISEFGFIESLRTVKFKAVEKQQNVIKVQKQIKTVSINDELKVLLQIKNNSDSITNYSVCQSFVDFLNSIDENLMQIQPTTFALAPGAKRDIEVTINMKEKQFDQLNKFLQNQTQYNEINYGTYQYLVAKAHNRHIQVQMPVLSSKNITEIASFQFFITDPHVNVEIVRDQFTDRAQSPASQRSPSRSNAPAPPKSAKGTPAKKGAPVEPPKEEIKQEDLTPPKFQNRITVDFGCVPVGGLGTRKVKLISPDKFMSFEEFIPRFDADIELLTHLHGVEVPGKKDLVLRFTPKKSGEQEEKFLIGCYTNKSKETRLNSVEIVAKGIGVQIQLGVQVLNPASSPLSAGTGDSQTQSKDKGKGAPETAPEPGKPIDHFLKPFKPGETQKIKLELKNLNTEYFYDIYVRQTIESPNYNVNILRKQMYIQTQPETSEIAIQSLQETSQLQQMQFIVRSGDFEQIINVYCFTTQDIGFIRYQDDVFACNNGNQPINLEIGSDKYVVQPTKYEKIKSGIVLQDGIVIATVK